MSTMSDRSWSLAREVEWLASLNEVTAADPEAVLLGYLAALGKRVRGFNGREPMRDDERAEAHAAATKRLRQIQRA